MQTYAEFFQAIFFFGLLSFFLLWIAKSKGYFVLPQLSERNVKCIRLSSVVIVFVIYLGMTMLVAPLLIWLAKVIHSSYSTANLPFSVLGWVQFLILIAKDPALFKRIWKDWSIPHPKPILTDFLMGAMTWIISFPLVLVVGQVVDMLLYFFFRYENFEQVAVHYLKTTLTSPPMLAVALFTILIAAPVIEEFLFRGCLQTFFKRFMSPRKAIALSALCFGLFHFSTSQGLGNISLIACLFTFALFLGFIYERQASLFASIGLHMTFNAASTFRILFFPDT
jgi:membrane protease YdiL (CAAX protease family)